MFSIFLRFLKWIKKDAKLIAALEINTTEVMLFIVIWFRPAINSITSMVVNAKPLNV